MKSLPARRAIDRETSAREVAGRGDREVRPLSPGWLHLTEIGCIEAGSLEEAMWRELGALPPSWPSQASKAKR